MALKHYIRHVVAVGLVATGAVLLLAPAGAQFFDDRFPWERRGGSIFGPPASVQPAPAPPRPVDYSRAPAPKKYEKNEAADLSTVLIMGDSLADYLGYGLEYAFADSPELAVVRKPRAFSSLIYNQTAVRNRNTDWPAAAREILAKENPAFVVMMIGLADREPIREQRPIQPAAGTTPQKSQANPGQTPNATAAQPKPTEGTPPASPQAPATPERESARGQADAETDAPHDDPAVAAGEPQRGGMTTHEFRTEKWAELYGKRVDETLAALKSKGAPVFWVGLPPIRGTRSMSEMVYLNDIVRSRVEKAGATYIDVWDGFVDEGNRFTVQGPDFEGQMRRLRTADGVHFTQAGARKLAHYLEKEIRRAMTPTGPVAIPIPVDPAASQPTIGAAPGGPTPRPLAGPVMPLNASAEALESEELAGATGARQSIADAVASRVLVRGEPLSVPVGRADDYTWPRRAPLPEGADPVVASTTLPMTPMVAERPTAPRAAIVASSPSGAGAAAKQARAPRPAGASHAAAQAQAQALAAQREAQMRRPQQRPPFFFFFFR